ncbi:hypothetical protein Misp01_31500 [Microtetraspora sp. NBRC 13810]|nr:hypothetical protein Misp01_31500 [Microtetraspora sp. NBRC 13810]
MPFPGARRLRHPPLAGPKKGGGMFIAYVVVTVLTIVANAWAAVADFARAGFVLANSAQVGVPQSWLPVLGALKAAGAAGLLLGLAGVRVLGVAAAAGLVLFFVGAVVVHIRTRVFGKIVFPGAFWRWRARPSPSPCERRDPRRAAAAWGRDRRARGQTSLEPECQAARSCCRCDQAVAWS